MTKQEFLDIIGRASSLTETDVAELDLMIRRFPYAQILHSLKAKALYNSNAAGSKQYLSTAAVYAPDRKELKRLIEEPFVLRTESFTEESKVSEYDEEIITAESLFPVEEELIEKEAEAQQEELKPDAENDLQTPQQDEVEEIDLSDRQHKNWWEEMEELQNSDHTNEVIPDEDVPGTVNDFTEEVYDDAGEEYDIQGSLNEISNTATDQAGKLNIHLDGEPEEIKEEIQAESGEISDAPEEDLVVADDQDPVPSNERTKNDVHSFLDWLKKLNPEERKDDKQPGSSPEENKPVIRDELDKLMIENVFHDGYLLEEERTKMPVIEFRLENNRTKLVEEFIQKEPVMGKPEDIINNNSSENKAKKSSNEDHIPVSETLAGIFLSQRLYHKAIAAYEKLSLKFPEKKPYFVALIQKIREENQIN